MVEYKGKNITDYFQRFSRPTFKRASSPPDAADQPPAVRQQSSSLSPLPSQLTSEPIHKEPIEIHRYSSPSLPEALALPTPKDEFSPGVTASFGFAPTQSSTIPSSQRIVKNGEVHILNSDDESDSDVSLEDLDDILKKKRTPSPEPEPEPQLPFLPHHEVPVKVNKKSTKRLNQVRPAEPEKLAPRHSLQALIKQKKEYETSKQNIAKVRDLLEHPERTECGQPRIDTDVLDGFMRVGGDEDDLDRLKLAIERTEALHHDQAWSFFENEICPSASPELSMPQDHELAPLLLEPSMRQQTFLSGFVEDYAMKDDLPEELLQWILQATCSEARDDLRQAYTKVMRGAASQMTGILDLDRLNLLFRRVGASQAALQVDAPVEPRAVPSEDSQSNKRIDLQTLINIIHHLSASLNRDTQVQAICLLCRLLLDKSTTTNIRILSSIEKALTTLLHHVNTQQPTHTPNSSPPISTILKTLHNTTSLSTLRVQLLRSLPQLSPQWLLLRRQLALAYFFSSKSYIAYPTSRLFSLPAIAAHLSTPTFALNNTTEYTLLTSTIQILDIALDSADQSPPLLISPREEKSFNEAIDALAAKLKSMCTSIIDSGASNMRRTEAKEVLEAVHSRLVYSVRTRPPRKKVLLFGGDLDGGELGGEREGMKKFLEKLRGERDEGRCAVGKRGEKGDGVGEGRLSVVQGVSQTGEFDENIS